jgi:hypothetical protein
MLMTCYFRHLHEVFRKAGIEVTEDNKREVDRIIHNVVGVSYKDCPATWKEVKKRIAADEGAFVSKLREAWGKRAEARSSDRREKTRK